VIALDVQLLGAIIHTVAAAEEVYAHWRRTSSIALVADAI